MIISPPFLSLEVPVYDAQCVRNVMPGGFFGDGAFPVSRAMAWHGGVHILAATDLDPVRAIADGVIVLRRDGGNARYCNIDHSTGCVVIRHTTEIGARGHAGVVVTYYSITQHLRSLDASLPAVGHPVYRKDVLGLAGTIFGRHDQIHFEIVAGDADALALMGRSTGSLDTSRDGRSDAVFGEAYVRLPPRSACFATRPAGVSPMSSADSGPDELFIGIRHAGHAELSTYSANGEAIGCLTEPDAEYNLYAEAVARHASATASSSSSSFLLSSSSSHASPPPGSSPSGWYELLRFGRNLGIDPLPANAPHWRKVVLPGHPQGAWVDLNAAGTTKFSDADFPPWRGWTLVDDDTTDNDSSCNSAELNAMLASPRSPDSTDPPPTLASKAAERLRNVCKPAMQEKLARMVCKFPTEWAGDRLRQRWSSIRKPGNPYVPQPLEDEAGFNEMIEFGRKLCFWEELPEEDRARLGMKHWHFHPREFITHFRKCGWLSKAELVRTIEVAPASGLTRAEALRQQMNAMLRKYLISSTRIAQAHFLAQVGHETGWWRYRIEGGDDRYFRTMYEEITFAEAVEDFRTGRAQRFGLVRAHETENSYAIRRPADLALKARGMENGLVSAVAGGLAGDGPRFRGRGFLQITGRKNYKSYGQFRGRDFLSEPNPALLASDDFNACDASGFFWAREKIGHEANSGAASGNVLRVGGIINRGKPNRIPVDAALRDIAFRSIWERLNDVA